MMSSFPGRKCWVRGWGAEGRHCRQRELRVHWRKGLNEREGPKNGGKLHEVRAQEEVMRETGGRKKDKVGHAVLAKKHRCSNNW